MSTYIDTKQIMSKAGCELQEGHDWREFTLDRLEWLYGEGRESSPAAQADVAAWNALGQRRAA